MHLCNMFAIYTSMAVYILLPLHNIHQIWKSRCNFFICEDKYGKLNTFEKHNNILFDGVITNYGFYLNVWSISQKANCVIWLYVPNAGYNAKMGHPYYYVHVFCNKYLFISYKQKKQKTKNKVIRDVQSAYFQADTTSLSEGYLSSLTPLHLFGFVGIFY